MSLPKHSHTVTLSCRYHRDLAEGVVLFTPFTVCFTLLFFTSSCIQSVGTKAWKVLPFLSSSFPHPQPLPLYSKCPLKKVDFCLEVLPHPLFSWINTAAPLNIDTLGDVYLRLCLVNRREKSSVFVDRKTLHSVTVHHQYMNYLYIYDTKSSETHPIYIQITVLERLVILWFKVVKKKFLKSL